MCYSHVAHVAHTATCHAHEAFMLCMTLYEVAMMWVQLLISKWAPAMSRDMLAHWLDLMNQQGWIAREQVGSLVSCMHAGEPWGGRGG